MNPAPSPNYSCPNCRANIAQDAARCSECEAIFGEADGWRPLAEGETPNAPPTSFADAAMTFFGVVLFLLLWVVVGGIATLAPLLSHGFTSVFLKPVMVAWVVFPLTLGFAKFSPSYLAGGVALVNFVLWLGFVVAVWLALF